MRAGVTSLLNSLLVTYAGGTCSQGLGASHAGGTLPLGLGGFLRRG